jgi:hypothetical protein
MDAKEKAKAGVWLLKQAVLEVVGANPGVTPNEVREELELFSPNINGDHKDTLLWGIANILAVEGLAEIRKEDGRNRMFLVERQSLESFLHTET